MARYAEHRSAVKWLSLAGYSIERDMTLYGATRAESHGKYDNETDQDRGEVHESS